MKTPQVEALPGMTPLGIRPASALEGMTQNKWDALSDREKDRLRDNSGLSPQLIGLEGWRVEVITTYGEKRRFIVGISTGWRPCHLEVSRRGAHGGGASEKTYASVKKLYYTR